MKAILAVIVLLLAALPAHADGGDLDALYRAQMEADLQKLDFSCAADFAQTPDGELLKALEQFWRDLKDDKDVPDDDIACRVRALVKRGHAWSDPMILFAYMFSKDRPDYALYLFTALERDRPHFADRMLAELYTREGAQQEISRATRMFRADASSLLSARDTPEECAGHILSLRREDSDPLHNAQFEWAASLCGKPEEEVREIAGALSQSDSIYDKIIADNIGRYITMNRLHIKLRMEDELLK